MPPTSSQFRWPPFLVALTRQTNGGSVLTRNLQEGSEG
jgi:hypothetical protein